jgi:hypothetical protein
MELAPLIDLLLTLRNQMKLYHWQTHSYAQHSSSDKLIDALDTLIDRFVETAMGHFGRPKYTNMTLSLRVFTTSAEAIQLLQKASDLFSQQKMPTDLATVRDDLVATIRQFIYVFSLN